MARLVLLPMFRSNNPSTKNLREILVLVPLGKQVAELDKCPALELIINVKKFPGLLDSGADASVMPIKHWPKAWPLQQAPSMVQGVEQVASPQISNKILAWEDTEGYKESSSLMC